MPKIIGTAEALKRALQEVHAPTEKGEGEFTPYDLLQEDNTLTVEQVRGRLRRMEQAGKLTSRKLLQNGKWVTAYRFVGR